MPQVVERRRLPPADGGGSARGGSGQRGLDAAILAPPVVASELRRQADAFIELQDLAPQIAPVSRQTENRIPKPARPDFDATHLN